MEGTSLRAEDSDALPLGIWEVAQPRFQDHQQVLLRCLLVSNRSLSKPKPLLNTWPEESVLIPLGLYLTACTAILSSMTLAWVFLRGSLQLLWSGRLAIPRDMLCDLLGQGHGR